MAGAVRQPIDVQSLSKYLEAHVREILLPVSLLQVGPLKQLSSSCVTTDITFSSAMANPTRHISLQPRMARNMYFARNLLGS